MRKVQLILLKESLSTPKKIVHYRCKGFLEEMARTKEGFDIILKLHYLPAIQKFLDTPTLFSSLFGEREEFWRFPITRWEKLKYWFFGGWSRTYNKSHGHGVEVIQPLWKRPRQWYYRLTSLFSRP